MKRRRIARHRKISDDGLANFRAEVEKIMALKTYKQLANESGLTLGSTQQLMAQLLREARAGQIVVHRGAKLLDIRLIAEEVTMRG
jgi:hypothetical protein